LRARVANAKMSTHHNDVSNLSLAWVHNQLIISHIMTEPYDERPPVINLQDNSKDRTLGTLSHILGPLVGFLAPILIYATYRGDDQLLKSHLIEAANASLTFLIAAIVHSLLMAILIGCLTFPVHWLLYIIWAINGNSALNAGQEYRYPLTIRFIS